MLVQSFLEHLGYTASSDHCPSPATPTPSLQPGHDDSGAGGGHCLDIVIGSGQYPEQS